MSVQNLNLDSIKLRMPQITSDALTDIEVNIEEATSTLFTKVEGLSRPPIQDKDLTFVLETSLATYFPIFSRLSEKIAVIAVPYHNVILLSLAYPLLISSMVYMMICMYRSIYNESSCLKGVIQGVDFEDCKNMQQKSLEFLEAMKDTSSMIKAPKQSTLSISHSTGLRKKSQGKIKLTPLVKVSNRLTGPTDFANFEMPSGKSIHHEAIDAIEQEEPNLEDKEEQQVKKKTAEELVKKQKVERRVLKEKSSDKEDFDDDEEIEKHVQRMAQSAFLSNLWRVAVSFLVILSLLTTVFILEFAKRSESLRLMSIIRLLFKIRGNLRFMEASIIDDYRRGITSRL